MSETVPETMTRSAFAKHLGCGPSYVTALGKAGRLVFTSDNKRVRVSESLDRIEATRDPNRDDVVARHAANRATAPPEEPETDATASTSFSEARARKAHWDAEKSRLEYEQLIGELCRTEEVRRAGLDAGVTLRGLLERLPDQLAPELALESDEARIHALMVDQVEAILTAVADKFSEKARAG
jgi:hypothetical protein